MKVSLGGTSIFCFVDGFTANLSSLFFISKLPKFFNFSTVFSFSESRSVRALTSIVTPLSALSSFISKDFAKVVINSLLFTDISIFYRRCIQVILIRCCYFYVKEVSHVYAI